MYEDKQKNLRSGEGEKEIAATNHRLIELTEGKTYQVLTCI